MRDSLVWGTRGSRAERAAEAAAEGEREPEKPTETTPEKTAAEAETDTTKNLTNNYNHNTTAAQKQEQNPDTARHAATPTHQTANTLPTPFSLLSLFSTSERSTQDFVEAPPPSERWERFLRATQINKRGYHKKENKK